TPLVSQTSETISTFHSIVQEARNPWLIDGQPSEKLKKFINKIDFADPNRFHKQLLIDYFKEEPNHSIEEKIALFLFYHQQTYPELATLAIKSLEGTLLRADYQVLTYPFQFDTVFLGPFKKVIENGHEYLTTPTAQQTQKVNMENIKLLMDQFAKVRKNVVPVPLLKLNRQRTYSVRSTTADTLATSSILPNAAIRQIPWLQKSTIQMAHLQQLLSVRKGSHFRDGLRAYIRQYHKNDLEEGISLFLFMTELMHQKNEGPLFLKMLSKEGLQRGENPYAIRSFNGSKSLFNELFDAGYLHLCNKTKNIEKYADIKKIKEFIKDLQEYRKRLPVTFDFQWPDDETEEPIATSSSTVSSLPNPIQIDQQRIAAQALLQYHIQQLAITQAILQNPMMWSFGMQLPALIQDSAPPSRIIPQPPTSNLPLQAIAQSQGADSFVPPIPPITNSDLLSLLSTSSAGASTSAPTPAPVAKKRKHSDADATILPPVNTELDAVAESDPTVLSSLAEIDNLFSN
ncbi:MAG TPA: hypothetical protein VLF61_04475, partial [Rhabdochlamydiaceae bacterium]|nr:hypothetical protein [Rhabdochlamydiaceae bacterium]